MSKGAFVAGFLVGGLAGAASALLMTPQPGQETRSQVQEKSVELKGRLGDLTAQARDQASKVVTQVQERGKTIVEERLQGSEVFEVPLDETPAPGENAATPTDAGNGSGV